MDDTIVAIASPPGGAARGIIRLSGPRLLDCLRACFVADQARDLGGLAVPSAVEGQLLLDQHRRLPGTLYVWPRTGYSGEPTAEWHTLGSPPLLNLAVQRFRQAGARLAERGEFTLRAYLHGRMDLTQAEAVLGVIDAASQAQLEVALGQLSGGLAQPLRQLRRGLLSLLEELEAGLDFPDEDLPVQPRALIASRLDALAQEVETLRSQLHVRGESTGFVRAVLVGRPNVGKSSLFNALTSAQALVSPVAGTTRDYLAAELDLGGIRCLLVDTAGQGATGEAVGQAAVQIAEQQQVVAQVEILCLDATCELDAWERQQLATSSSDRLVVLTKIDQQPGAVSEDGAARHPATASREESPRVGNLPNVVSTSVITGEGLEELRQQLRLRICAAQGVAAVAATAARCRQALDEAAEALGRADSELAAEGKEELAAHDLRLALDELGRVAGAVYTEDLLAGIFRRFCVGK